MQPNAFMIRSKGILEKAAITKLIRELSSWQPIEPHWHAVAT
jgi:hypothetical protein